LTQGYAGPAGDLNYNSRQAFDPYEYTLYPAYIHSTMSTTRQRFFEVDDSQYQLPPNAPSNPIMAEPLYVVGITVSSPAQGTCSGCNMLVAVTLNDTIFAWVADGTQAGNLLWSRQGDPSNSNNPPGNAGNALWRDDCGLGGGPVPRSDTTPFMGILSTPVIDASGSTPVMFLTDWCQTSGSTPMLQWNIHEINLKTGVDITPSRWIGSSMDFGGSGFQDVNQTQRAALLEVPNPHSGGNPLVYLAFGTGTVEDNATAHPYNGWLLAYTTGSGALSPETGFPSVTPTSCGSGGGMYMGSNNGQCTTGNLGTPHCDCYLYNTAGYQNAPNWGGQGGGCWMSGHGPAATTAGAINSDGNVHVFLGCGNGGFQEFNGTTPDVSNNYGQSVMDFRVTSSGYDTSPFQSFTPRTPLSGVGPSLPSVCGDTGSGCAGCGACSYTFQAMNVADWDQSTGGLFCLTTSPGPNAW